MAAAVSRLLLLHLSTSSSSPASSAFLLRPSQRYHRGTFPSLFSSFSCPARRAPFFTSILRPLSRPYATGEAAAVDPEIAPLPPPALPLSHPWPEWEQFLDELLRKGYFELSTSSSKATEEGGDGDGGGGGGGGASALAKPRDLTVDVNRVKNACLKFARERFDIFRSLPKEDIRAIVECGCPNLYRKPVNSAKRLRSYLRLDEGKVCGSCCSRGSCDKADTIPKEEGARTVDVVRILLSYAINSEDISEKENSSLNQLFHDSARKLLSKLIKLSGTTIDPSLPKPAIVSSTKKDQFQRVNVKNKPSPNAEMKGGDWLCQNCNFLNFARNLRCLECKEDGPKRVKFDQAEMKPGDWNCPKCEFMNFSRNRNCFRCDGARPKRELNPGEWECPSCNYVNFSRNMVCKKCDIDRPEGPDDSGMGNHSWKKPAIPRQNRDRTEGSEMNNHSWKKPAISRQNRDRPEDSGMGKRSWKKPAIPRQNRDANLEMDEDELDEVDTLPQLGEKNKLDMIKRETTAKRRSTPARRKSYS